MNQPNCTGEVAGDMTALQVLMTVAFIVLVFFLVGIIVVHFYDGHGQDPPQAGTLERKLFDMAHPPMLTFIERGCVAMAAIAVPVLSLEHWRLAWSHIWFMTTGVVLTMCFGIRKLHELRHEIAEMIEQRGGC